MNKSLLYFIVAGEASGDILGARMMAALRNLTNGSVRFAGVGGPAMQAQGLVSIFPMEELSVMGVFEILPQVVRLFRRMRETARAIDELKPAAILTIDAPAFAHGVVNRVCDPSIPRIHYVAPTVWAWRPWRVHKFKRHFDHLLVLFPFEPLFFKSVGLPCTFVGHPVIESGANRGDGIQFRKKHVIEPETKILCVLLGSRRSEVQNLGSVFGEALKRLKKDYPDLIVILPTIATLADNVREISSSWSVPTIVIIKSEDKFNAMAASNAAIAASGTVSLELAMARVPTIIAYRLPWLTYFVVKGMSLVKFVTLINILLDREIVPELLQGNCSARKIFDSVSHILDSGGEDQVLESRKALKLIGMGGEHPSIRAARMFLNIVAKGTNNAVIDSK